MYAGGLRVAADDAADKALLRAAAARIEIRITALPAFRRKCKKGKAAFQIMAGSGQNKRINGAQQRLIGVTIDKHQLPPRSPNSGAQIIDAHVGERRHVVLPDGDIRQVQEFAMYVARHIRHTNNRRRFAVANEVIAPSAHPCTAREQLGIAPPKALLQMNHIAVFTFEFGMKCVQPSFNRFRQDKADALNSSLLGIDLKLLLINDCIAIHRRYVRGPILANGRAERFRLQGQRRALSRFIAGKVGLELTFGHTMVGVLCEFFEQRHAALLPERFIWRDIGKHLP